MMVVMKIMVLMLFTVMGMMVMKVMCAAIKSERGPTFSFDGTADDDDGGGDFCDH